MSTEGEYQVKHCVPFDFCDECEDGKDRYPVDELFHFNDDLRLCAVHAASRIWKAATPLPDSYDRLTKCENDK